jgi:hypothetical protein
MVSAVFWNREFTRKKILPLFWQYPNLAWIKVDDGSAITLLCSKSRKADSEAKISFKGQQQRFPEWFHAAVVH